MFRANTDLLRQSNQAGVQFLLAEIAAGLTFLQMARTAATTERRDWNFMQSRKAYATALRLQSRVTPTPAEKCELETRMTELSDGLTAAGYRPPPPPAAIIPQSSMGPQAAMG